MSVSKTPPITPQPPPIPTPAPRRPEAGNDHDGDDAPKVTSTPPAGQGGKLDTLA